MIVKCQKRAEKFEAAKGWIGMAADKWCQSK